MRHLTLDPYLPTKENWRLSIQLYVVRFCSRSGIAHQTMECDTKKIFFNTFGLFFPQRYEHHSANVRKTMIEAGPEL